MKQVYSGEYQVYAQDTAAGTYAQEGCYTYYAALYADAKRTKKVSDVKEITVNGLSGTAAFGKLENGTYYLGETDQYGNVVESSNSCTVKYTNAGKSCTIKGNATAEIQNVYSELPRGYRYTATLTITKKLAEFFRLRQKPHRRHSMQAFTVRRITAIRRTHHSGYTEQCFRGIRAQKNSRFLAAMI